MQGPLIGPTVCLASASRRRRRRSWLRQGPEARGDGSRPRVDSRMLRRVGRCHQRLPRLRPPGRHSYLHDEWDAPPRVIDYIQSATIGNANPTTSVPIPDQWPRVLMRRSRFSRASIRRSSASCSVEGPSNLKGMSDTRSLAARNGSANTKRMQTPAESYGRDNRLQRRHSAGRFRFLELTGTRSKVCISASVTFEACRVAAPTISAVARAFRTTPLKRRCKSTGGSGNRTA